MQKNYNENLVAGAAIRDDKGRRISKLFESTHPKMTVGYANNLIIPNDPTEQEFNFRQSGGGVIEDGIAAIDKVKGNSAVWNQLVKNGNFASIEGWVQKGATISISNGEATITQTLKGDFGIGQKVNVVAGNKIMVLVDMKEVTSMYVGVFRSTSDNIGFESASNAKVINSVGVTSFFTTIAELGSYKSYTFGFARGGVNSFIKVRSVNLIDLTQMFGAGNEPTAYEEFLQRKPKVEDEYAYNEGTIVNNKVEKVVTTGVNLIDISTSTRGKSIDTDSGKEQLANNFDATDFIPVLPNTIYRFGYSGCKGDWAAYYDENKNYVSGAASLGASGASSFITPSNARYFRIAYLHTEESSVFLNIGSNALPYAPYEKHELDLSWVKEIKDTEGVKLFEDGMRSAGTAFDEAAKGRAIKRIGVYTFNGTEDWIINTYAQDKGIMAYQCYSGLKPINDNIRCDRFVTGSWENFAPMTIFAIPSNGIIIETDGTQSLADFKASLEAKPLDVYYELAEPIEVEYDEKSLTYPVVAGGTEEAIASEPSTAFRADIGYGIDAVKTILDLKARVKALEEK